MSSLHSKVELDCVRDAVYLRVFTVGKKSS